MTDPIPNAPRAGSASRRAVLRLGAIAIPAVVTLKPAFAAATSVMNCEIPLDRWVDAYGNVQAAGTENAFASMPSISTTDGQSLSPQAFNAHVEYIKKLQRGSPGFTCFASIAARRVA